MKGIYFNVILYQHLRGKIIYFGTVKKIGYIKNKCSIKCDGILNAIIKMIVKILTIGSKIIKSRLSSLYHLFFVNKKSCNIDFEKHSQIVLIEIQIIYKKAEILKDSPT